MREIYKKSYFILYKTENILQKTYHINPERRDHLGNNLCVYCFGSLT
jgi:hypothetical protein